MKKLTLSEIIASILLFGTGLFTFERGIFWFVEQESVLGDSAFYLQLHQLFPIWLWGVLFMMSGALLVMSRDRKSTRLNSSH